MKVLIVYNESDPEIYEQAPEISEEDLDFKPYFDLENSNPIDEYEAMAKALRRAGYDAYTLNIMDNLQHFFDNIDKNKPDVVFNLMELYKDVAIQEMNFAGLLELLDIPYTGAPPLALGTCQSKILTKRILSSIGIRTPNYRLVKSLNKPFRINLNYPLIVKPALEDASVGIEEESIVYNVDALKKRVKYVLEYFAQPALVEEFIVGRELNVAVFGDKEPEVLPISEIDFSKLPDDLHPIVSYQAKWDPYHVAYHKTIPKCPAPLSNKIRKEAEEIALKAVKAVGCRDYARVDMRLSEDKRLYVLEVNPNPDLQQDAGFMRSARTAGYSYSRALKMIVDFAYMRKRGSNGK
ncbi:D-alanine-D-alanine ligase [Melioribacter roseus P3M-2]|uniref:D-alanine-D-alanine ligase n=1 Tax=Melioribacter roseus (strain DSM 23840 / JCM 17771 / VKM B-2668 / P3M-2) TaxID=1191523 RepID=I6ZRR9_MELRP|nr:ATP-grasp domain-containing protein [Melioribacter roseus]AFN74759.1 D-alanine-D-alanine ligase [Melioribacter roseus P3M-2]